MPISHADYLAMQARLQKNTKTVEVAESKCTDESKLHEQIQNYCRDRGYLCFNGSMAHRAMRTVGENDFHCLLPKGVVLFVEAKTATGKLSPEQLGVALWADKLDHKIWVVRSIEAFASLCEKALKFGAGSRTFTGKDLENSPP